MLKYKLAKRAFHANFYVGLLCDKIRSRDSKYLDELTFRLLGNQGNPKLPQVWT